MGKGETEYVIYLAFQIVLYKGLLSGAIKKSSGVERGKALESSWEREKDTVVTFSQAHYSTSPLLRISLKAGIKYINDLERKHKRTVKITLVNQA